MQKQYMYSLEYRDKSGWKTITLVDIRYLQPERLGTWLTFDTQDVLFLYSAPVLNSSETIR